MSFRGDTMYQKPIIPNGSTSPTPPAPPASLRNAGASVLLSGTQTRNSSSMSNLFNHTHPAALLQTSSVDYDIYNKAIAVSSPRVEGDLDHHQNVPPVVRRKVVRRVEVPFTRQVKVPTTTTQLIPTVVEQRVPVRKLVAVPGFKLVDEEYTEYEEREAVREKEVWVKKIVPERFIEKVPVQRVRQVQKPTTLIKEVETYETVQVPTTKKVTVDGWRVDQVQDSKVVEVEEYQDYELKPTPVGEPHIANTTDLGRLPHSRLARSVGHQVFAPNHPTLSHLDEDEEAASSVPPNSHFSSRGPVAYTGQPAAPLPQSLNASAATSALAQQQQSSYNNSFYRPSSPTSRNLNIHGTSSLSAHQQEYGAFQPHDVHRVPLNDPRSVTAAGAYRKPAVKTTENSANENTAPLSASVYNSQQQLGMSVDDTHTRHSDGTGVQVTAVVRGAGAARAGLQPHDIITSVNGVPSSTVDEFNQLAARSAGPLALTINRDGRRNITLTLYR